MEIGYPNYLFDLHKLLEAFYSILSLNMTKSELNVYTFRKKFFKFLLGKQLNPISSYLLDTKRFVKLSLFLLFFLPLILALLFLLLPLLQKTFQVLHLGFNSWATRLDPLTENNLVYWDGLQKIHKRDGPYLPRFCKMASVLSSGDNGRMTGRGNQIRQGLGGWKGTE